MDQCRLEVALPADRAHLEGEVEALAYDFGLNVDPEVDRRGTGHVLIAVLGVRERAVRFREHMSDLGYAIQEVQL